MTSKMLPSMLQATPEWRNGVAQTGCKPILINTPLQRGARHGSQQTNRFSGFFYQAVICGSLETAEAVQISPQSSTTPLKQGGDERSAFHRAGGLHVSAVDVVLEL
jgi:hypothetical protein